jgi:hypothetical protein
VDRHLVQHRVAAGYLFCLQSEEEKAVIFGYVAAADSLVAAALDATAAF